MDLNTLKPGDTVECRDKDDMVDTMWELEDGGFETEFIYEKNGKKGLWLKVVKVG